MELGSPEALLLGVLCRFNREGDLFVSCAKVCLGLFYKMNSVHLCVWVAGWALMAVGAFLLAHAEQHPMRVVVRRWQAPGYL